MATQTSTTTTTQTRKLKIVTDKILWLADKDAPAVKFHSQNETKTFFLLDLVGLSMPPLLMPAILLLLGYSRQLPFWDIFFSVAFPLYLCIANRFRFDNNARQVAARKQRGHPHPQKPEWFKANNDQWFVIYMLNAATIGVILPLLLQVLAPAPIAQAAAPPVYMLLSQILMEMMGNGPKFHPMLQLMTPIGFCAYRMAGLKTWLVLAWQMVSSTDYGSSDAILNWEMVHFMVALSNSFLWTYNLFVMLLLRIAPPCLDEYQFPDAKVSWKYQLVPTVSESNPPKIKN
jgi:hypothetical protein